LNDNRKQRTVFEGSESDAYPVVVTVGDDAVTASTTSGEVIVRIHFSESNNFIPFGDLRRLVEEGCPSHASLLLISCDVELLSSRISDHLALRPGVSLHELLERDGHLADNVESAMRAQHEIVNAAIPARHDFGFDIGNTCSQCRTPCWNRGCLESRNRVCNKCWPRFVRQKRFNETERDVDKAKKEYAQHLKRAC